VASVVLTPRRGLVRDFRPASLVSARLDCLAVSAEEVDKYLRGVEEPKRSTLEALRSCILEVVPDAEQVISYRVFAFCIRGTTVAGFAAFKDHLSYLPFSGSVLAQLDDELKGYTRTKSALHLRRPRISGPIEAKGAFRERASRGSSRSDAAGAPPSPKRSPAGRRPQDERDRARHGSRTSRLGELLVVRDATACRARTLQEIVVGLRA